MLYEVITERKDVRRALPDRQHLGVAQQDREAAVLDVADAAEALEDLRDAGDRLLSGHELDQRRRQAQQRPLADLRLPAADRAASYNFV